MIKSIDVTNNIGDNISFILTRPELSGFVVKSVDGLGPVSSNVNVREITSTDGAQFVSSRVSSRNIVLHLSFLPPNVEEKRHLCYSIFPVKTEVTITVRTDDRNASIKGYVESLEPDIFSDKEGAVVSIICPFPYFKEVDSITDSYDFLGTNSSFEFKYSNEGSSPVTKFGDLVTQLSKTVYNLGDVTTGCIIKIRARGSVVNPFIKRLNDNAIMSLKTVNEFIGRTALLSGEELIISTISGNKNIYILKTNGESESGLGFLSDTTEWMQMYPGQNKIEVGAETGKDNMEVSLTFPKLYIGV